MRVSHHPILLGLVIAGLCSTIAFAAPPEGDSLAAPEISFGSDGKLDEKPIFMEGTIGNQAVDDEGKIYDERQYGGIVPARRDRFEAGPKAGVPTSAQPNITWVGFQQRTSSPTTYRVPACFFKRINPPHTACTSPTRCTSTSSWTRPNFS